MSTASTKLQAFRTTLYALFPKRGDAIMNLLDALISTGHQAKSPVQLSNARCFQRQYSSVTDAIADGLPYAQWDQIMQLAYESTKPEIPPNMHRFVVDCTPNPRPFAKKLKDRTINHAPNPAPGNKPICVGHQYSTVALLPEDAEAAKKHWILPVSAQRVHSHQKGNEAGMEQITKTIETLGLTNHLSLSIGDSLYGTLLCRMAVAEQENRVHLFRLNSTRNVFAPPEHANRKGSTGRHKEFGKKMKLNDPSTLSPSDEQTTTTWTTRRGKQYSVHICRWNNYLLRGSRDFRSSLHPIHVIKVVVKDETGQPLYQRPLWLAVLGKRRDELDLIQCYENYTKRYDIEHFFRFGKRCLLMDAYQTPEVEHEANWWKLCLLAYVELYLARSAVPLMPNPWERYLPAYKNTSETEIVTTPSQTQRGFVRLLESIGTPAADCVQRGKPRGRQIGEVVPVRENQAIIFKQLKSEISTLKKVLSTSDIEAKQSNSQTIQTLIKEVHAKLTKLGFTPTEFVKLFQDSG